MFDDRASRPQLDIRALTIEISTACNHRCKYCPVSIAPKQQRFLSVEIFEHVIRLLRDYSTARGVRFNRVSFNHYNEPLLDPRFSDLVIQALSQNIFDFILVNTNLSHLTNQTLNALEPFRRYMLWNINVPTTDRKRYAFLHGRDDLEKVVKNIHGLRSRHFDVAVNLQCNRWTTEDDHLGVIRELGPLGIVPESSWSRSRAGAIPELGTVYHDDLISGCHLRRPTTVLNIGVDGAVFLCCEDYDQTSSFGNVRDYENLADLLEDWRREIAPIYGNGNLPADHICRRCSQAITRNTSGRPE